jgi:hypothetical protein
MAADGYRVRGRTAATVATAGHAIAALWNPHTSARIEITEVALFKTAVGTAADAILLQRITARGTPGSTVTPLIGNADERDIAAPAGALLDLAAYTGQPTVDASAVPLWGWVAAAVAGSGFIYPTGGITIPPGAGLAITQVAGTIWPISEVGFRYQD